MTIRDHLPEIGIALGVLWLRSRNKFTPPRTIRRSDPFTKRREKEAENQTALDDHIEELLDKGADPDQVEQLREQLQAALDFGVGRTIV